ncbi:YceI family protein [Hanstruepera ponticola]|uniref:YceI family protein n=1 Tax=Hanstruepera ponticola TaxID=2042995 RepID=UPI0017810CEF|nr:YceI family protein [Hanstruepera ponticola]
MRTIKQNGMMWLFAILTVIFTSQNILAQQFNLNNSKSDMSILGTSSLHDWEEVVEEHSGSIELIAEEETDISNLNVSIVAESIKSGKSAMDKNTYKALDTKNHKTITFKMIDSKKVTALGNSVYQVTVSGKLSIAGVAKTIDLSFKMKVASGVVTLEGEKTFNMTDYGIEPPKALFGTITTGDEVIIKFNSVFN